MTTLVFRFPMPANLANSRMHWAVKNKSRTAYWRHLDLLKHGKILPPPPKVPFEKVVIKSEMVLGSAMDHDNAVARHKYVIDWLKKRKYIVDDGPKRLRWAGFPSQRVSRKNEPEILITLTDESP